LPADEEYTDYDDDTGHDDGDMSAGSSYHSDSDWTTTWCQTCSRDRPRNDVYWSMEPYSNGKHSKCVRCAGYLSFCESCKNYRTNVNWEFPISLPSWKLCERNRTRSEPMMANSFCRKCMASEKPHRSMRIIRAFRRAYAAGCIASVVRCASGFERIMKKVYAPWGKGQKRGLAEVGDVVEHVAVRRARRFTMMQ
jgi:hypothetical protein